MECDILVMEATYAGRDHTDRATEEDRLVKRVQDIRARGGAALIPSFASGRGQDIIKILHDGDPSLNVHYDSMGTRVSRSGTTIPTTYAIRQASRRPSVGRNA